MYTAIRKDNESGFTLIELLVAIVIVGLLSAIAIPLFQRQTAEAELATLKADVRNTATGAAEQLMSGAASGAEEIEPVLTTGTSIDISETATGYTVCGTRLNVEQSWGFNSETGTYGPGCASVAVTYDLATIRAALHSELQAIRTQLPAGSKPAAGTPDFWYNFSVGMDREATVCASSGADTSGRHGCGRVTFDYDSQYARNLVVTVSVNGPAAAEAGSCEVRNLGAVGTSLLWGYKCSWDAARWTNFPTQ